MKSSSAFQKIVRCLRKEGLELGIQAGDGQIVRFDVPIPGPGGQAEIFITTSEDGIVFIAMLSQRAAERKREVAELVCRVNRTIRLGRFDLDFKTGEIRFYHSLSASFFRWNALRRTTEELALVCTTVRDVAPGDFKTASQGLYYLGEEVTNELRLDALEREADFKNRNRKAWTASRERRIGFAPPARDARDNKEGNGKT